MTTIDRELDLTGRQRQIIDILEEIHRGPFDPDMSALVTESSAGLTDIVIATAVEIEETIKELRDGVRRMAEIVGWDGDLTADETDEEALITGSVNIRHAVENVQEARAMWIDQLAARPSPWTK
jgi:hypothetical protein